MEPGLCRLSARGPVPGSTRPESARTRSARHPSRFSCRYPPLAGGSDDDAIILEPFRLELEARQAAVLDSLAAEAETFMRLRERLGQLAHDPVGVDALPLRNLDQHLDLVLATVGGVEVDAELVDLLVLADDRLDRARIDVRPSNQFHIIDPSANAALVEVEGAATGATACRHPDHEVPGAITQHR